MYRFPLTVSHYFDDCDCFISFYAPFSLECVWSQTHSLGEVLERGCMVLLISSCSSVATYFKGAQNCAVIKVLIGEVNQFAKLSLNFFFKKIFLFLKSPILNNILSYLFPDKDHLKNFCY